MFAASLWPLFHTCFRLRNLFFNWIDWRLIEVPRNDHLPFQSYYKCYTNTRDGLSIISSDANGQCIVSYTERICWKFSSLFLSFVYGFHWLLMFCSAEFFWWRTSPWPVAKVSGVTGQETSSVYWFLWVSSGNFYFVLLWKIEELLYSTIKSYLSRRNCQFLYAIFGIRRVNSSALL